jgi:hypothetical protein
LLGERCVTKSQASLAEVLLRDPNAYDGQSSEFRRPKISGFRSGLKPYSESTREYDRLIELLVEEPKKKAVDG